jgi:hypothetical protein
VFWLNKNRSFGGCIVYSQRDIQERVLISYE